MGDEDRPDVKRIRLTGARFDGGRLPIDSLSELQDYQKVVRIAAAAQWRSEHPGEELPAGFAGAVSLTIEEIHEGSADVFLSFEQQQEYVQYQAEAQDASAMVNSVIAAAYRDEDVPDLPVLSPEEDSLFFETLSHLGGTLTPEQSMEFYIDGPDAAPVTVTVETRKTAILRLAKIDSFLQSPEETPTSKLQKDEQSLIGRITLLDANKMSYELALPDGHKIRGHYRNAPTLLEDFRKVLNSEEQGPLTRITGELQRKADGSIWRFWETRSLEQVEFDDTVWGARLAELAGLAPQWDGAAAGQVSSVSLDAAQLLLREIDATGKPAPGIFPTEDGGVLLEWSSPAAVRSIEILEDGTFETFTITSGQQTGEHDSTGDLSVVVAFIRADEA
ncbi:hypothetical protein FGL91_15100 [Microbacterium sp. CBA3102]|uniref:hypothetical protein n=1 Tax=Microbacterium sp. CBA3102 TaxID=2603598 RepID=UPI0011BB2670|nr:hypothetical protein [Microbacterium sp. CBA3102]QEA29763.1 hypothetical protein FGL91_15100 [Microbacterium sp. CBA3102]